MRKYGRKFLAGILVLALAGCGQIQELEIEGTQAGLPVKIPIVFLIDAVTNERENEELVRAFNETYKGRYEADVEWMTVTPREYRSHLKRWNVEDELPAVITDVCFTPAFYQMMLEDGRLVDLSPYVDQDPEWKAWFGQGVLDTCREKEASLYVCPTASNCFSYSGIFYNKELFQKAGIETFPNSWDAFFECCTKLENAGITPLSLHTGGTAWAPMLFATAYLGASREGKAFMQERLPNDYSGKAGQELAWMLEKIFEYASADCIYQDFDVAYQKFIDHEAAMIPNGYWMMIQFSQEQAKSIGFAPFPEDVMVASAQSSGWGIVSSYPKEVQEGAVEFLKFRTLQTHRQAEEFLEHDRKAATLLEQDYLNAVNREITVIPNYQLQWNPILQDEVLAEELPRLLYHMIDEEEFIEAMNDSVRRYQEE